MLPSLPSRMSPPEPNNLEEAKHLIAELSETVSKQQSQIAWLTRQVFGRTSERLARDEEPGLFAGLDASADEADAADPTETQTVTYQRRSPQRGKRTPIPDDLPRYERVHDLPEDQKAGMKWIGQQTSEQLEIEPGKVYVVRDVRYTYARIEQDEAPQPASPNVITAERPAEGLPRCLAGPSLLAQVMVGKFADHQPLHRLEKMLKRSGVAIPRSSMCRWAQDLGVMLNPLMRRMKQQVLHSHVIQADETPVKQQEHGRGKTKTCYFYSYVGDKAGPYVLYDYQGTRSRAGPDGWFVDGHGEPNYHGCLQCDGYAGYNDLFDPAGPWRMSHIGCWAHARRKFYDVRGDFPGPCHHALGQIRQLYEIEREAEAMTPEQRQALRDRKSRSIVEAMLSWADQQQAQVLPKTGLGDAISYMLNQAEALRRYLDDGRLELDNNRCERSLRGIAIGRRNWLFTGSEAGGRAAATMFSLIASAHRHELEPLSYLTDVFRRLPATPVSQLDRFLPDRWQAPTA